MEKKKIKAWFTYYGEPNFLHCNMVFENGWCAFGHLCSSPGWAASDLYERRTERKAVLEKMGIEPDIQGTIHIDELPREIMAKNKDESNYKEMAEEYSKVEKEMALEKK